MLVFSPDEWRVEYLQASEEVTKKRLNSLTKVNI